jgi:BASS family bile acid:Na+ symporter
MTLANVILLVLKTSLFLSVMAIGLKATLSDTTYLFRRPAQLMRALLSINVFMPLIALMMAATFDLDPAVKIALVTLSVSPVPPVMPHKALQAGGREEYTIGLFTAGLILSVAIIALTLELFDQLGNVPLRMSARSIALTVAVMTVLPLTIGIILRAVLPVVADRAARPLSLISLVLLVISFLPVLFGMFSSMLVLIGDGTLFDLGAFAVVGLIVGHLFGGPLPEDRTVLTLATSSRHPAIAATIAHVNFPNEKLAIAAVFLYLIISGILFIPYLKWVKRSQAKSDPVTRKKPAAV